MSTEFVKVGDKIPATATESNRDPTKVIKVTFYNLFGLVPLAGGGPFTLAHEVNGTYSDASFTFPTGIEKIFAQYLVFDADGVTPNTTGQQVTSDIYVLDTLDAAIADIKTAVRGADLVATIDDGGTLIAEISEDATLIAEIDETRLTAVIADNNNLTAEISGGDNLEGEIL